MNSLAVLLAPLALLLPSAAGELAHRTAPRPDVLTQSATDDRKAPPGLSSAPLEPLRVLEEARALPWPTSAIASSA